MSAKLTIIRLDGVIYRRSRSHCKRLIAAGTHEKQGPQTLREVRTTREAFVLRDRVFVQSPRTSKPPDFLPFNFPLPYELLVSYQ